MAIVIHNNIEDYSFEEKRAVEVAFNELEEKAQGGELTLEETRVRVAWVRLKREENFKISQPTIRAKKVKEISLEDALAELSGEVVTPKQKRVAKVKVKKEKDISELKIKIVHVTIFKTLICIFQNFFSFNAQLSIICKSV